MREKRIIKVTKKSGKVVYSVEERVKILGFVISDWHQIIDRVILPSGKESPLLRMEFSTLEEAKIYSGIDIDPITKREIIE